ncbi:DUF6153 family protein [Nocardiopsis oceani]
MSPSEPRLRRRGPAWVRILLFTVLLLGFGAMHTLGHLQHEAHASTAPAPASASAHANTSAEPSGKAADSAHAADHGTALPELDPTSVCLTLGAFSVVLLGVAAVAFHRWPGPFLNPSAPVRRPPPPPPSVPDEPSLSRLQVLRI